MGESLGRGQVKVDQEKSVPWKRKNHVQEKKLVELSGFSKPARVFSNFGK